MKKLQRTGQSHDILSSATENCVALDVRVRQDSTTVILPPFEEIGVLDNKMAAVLHSLKDIAPTITTELFLDHEEDQSHCVWAGKKMKSIRPLQIQIYGPDKYYKDVGLTLSSAGMYLQEPLFLDHGVIYQNPHFLSWDNNADTPLFNLARNDTQTDFITEIEAILDSFSPVLRPSLVVQDARIVTTLRKYDLVYKQLYTRSNN